MRSKVLLGFATTALIVTFFLGLAIDKEIAVREPPSPVSLLLVYFVSFVWLAVPIVEYSHFQPEGRRIGEEELVVTARAVSLGFFMGVPLSLLGLFVSASLGDGVGIRSFAGLAAVWLGTFSLPYLAVGPEYVLLTSKSNRGIAILHPLSAEGHALFSTSLTIPSVRSYTLKFAFGPWFSVLMVGYGFYLVFGNLLGLLSLLMIILIVTVAKYLATSSMPPEKIGVAEDRVKQIAKAVRYSGRSVMFGIVVFSAWLIYLATALR